MSENPKRKKNDIWDISIYTDEEIIHNLLNMSNPTDRELEIKIWSHIQQYKSSQQTPDNLRWLNFYEQIYHRLFSFSEDERENFETHEEEDTDNEQDPSPSQQITEGFDNNITVTATPAPVPTTPTPTTTKPPEGTSDTNSTKLVTQLQYATGNVNPLLKETITRSLTIDSQYRDNKQEPTTSFILNLTETIKNVVNISLYSIHIPFTWYTISTNYGSNYFYLQPNAAGLDNGYNAIKVEIPSGNYSQVTLAAAINQSFQNLQTTYTDICFGSTLINYNSTTMLMTFTIDIQNIYNQNNYYLSFPKNPLQDYSGSVVLTDLSYINMRRTTIPSFLGLTQTIYNLQSIISSRNVPYSTSTQSDLVISDISVNNIYPNNKIWIYQYQDTGTIFNPTTSTILATYSITIPPASYSISSLTTKINDIIQNSSFLIPTNSYFKQIPIPGTTLCYFELNLIFNRVNTVNQQYINSVIFLPDDTSSYKIWTGDTSTFQFVPQYHSFPINPNNSTTPIGTYFPFYQNEIYSDYATLQTNYYIDASVAIIFTSTNPYYKVPQNDYIVKITSSSINIGYILPEYVSAIQNAFNHPINMASGQEISGNNLFNTSINLPFYINNTNSKAYFNIDMNKIFNENMYTINISNSPLFTVLNIGKNVGSGNGIIDLMDLSSNDYTIDFSFNITSSYDMSCSTLMTIYSTPNTNYGNQNAPPFYIPPNYTENSKSGQPPTIYNSLPTLQKDIQAAFTNYNDIILDTIPFKNISITINNDYTGNIKFSITQTITETNYSMSLYDPNSSWSKYLFFNDNSGAYLNTDVSYQLIDYYVQGQSYSEIIGSKPVLNVIIDIDNSNNQFSIVPLSTTDTLQSNSNIYTYTIQPGSYTRDQLLSEMNKAFQSNSDTYYTSIGLKTINGSQYAYFFIEVNKVFTSSDYNLVFYDSRNFQECSLGITTIGNTSWDTTLGWILGFREYTSYNLINYISTPTVPPSKLNNISTLIADTTCSTTLFNYFILSLDDFNQNHTNDGLVTITTIEKSIPLPSYAQRSNFVCDPTTGQYLYTGITSPGTNNLTQNQIYAITEIMNNNVNASTLYGNVPMTKYSYGPFISDVLAVIPIKTAGVVNGQTIIIDGGTLQTQNRKYFGPINLNRLSITLYDDRGHVVNLNNSNWSFTLLVDQLYKKSAASS